MDGNSVKCSKCWLHIRNDGEKYLYKQYNSHCGFYFEEMCVEELQQSLADMFVARDEKLLCDLNFLMPLFVGHNSKRQDTWIHSSLVKECSAIGGILMLGDEKEIQISEGLFHKVISFLGLLDPIDTNVHVSILDRLNYLFTVAQLEESQERYYDCESPVFRNPWVQGFEAPTKGEI